MEERAVNRNRMCLGALILAASIIACGTAPEGTPGVTDDTIRVGMTTDPDRPGRLSRPGEQRRHQASVSARE